MSLFFLYLAAFLIGGIPSSYILVKAKHGKDIRTMGSKNPGATNVFRSVGKKEGWIVLVCDVLKGVVAVSLARGWSNVPFDDPRLFLFTIGAAAILGHVFTPFLKFKGGKGVATSAGVAIAVYPLSSIIAIAIWVIVLRVSRYMSIASMTAAYTFAISVLILVPGVIHAVLALIMAFFITWTHRANIRRLLNHEEPQFRF